MKEKLIDIVYEEAFNYSKPETAFQVNILATRIVEKLGIVELVEAAQELAMLVDDAASGEYEIDHFTTQPVLIALAKVGK